MNFQCRLIDQGKACDQCDSGGTALHCFGFRLEHLVDQMAKCEDFDMTYIHQAIRANYRFEGLGESPLILRWADTAMLRNVGITFSHYGKHRPSIFFLSKMRDDGLRCSWFFHDEWVEAFCGASDIAQQYCHTDSREV